MPIPIPYAEALRIVRRFRKAHNTGNRSRKYRMSVPERERLGALVIEFLSQYAEAQRCSNGVDVFTLPTDLGPLYIHYAVEWGAIFQRFGIPNRTVGSNPHNGKWNFHHSAGYTADAAFLDWKTQLGRVFRRPTD